jgi:uncharacterized protein YqjF (DUF2071 family)
MAFSFLTARWSNLFLANFAVPRELLLPRLPAGLELDTREGQCFVSLVAFDFLDTRVLGVPWPGYRNFAEINLRFYVRHGAERGVVFVREFVPHHLTAWLARTLYNEPYQAAPVSSSQQGTADSLSVEYHLNWAGRRHTIRVTGNLPAFRPTDDSVEHFFKEHHWGFGRTASGKTLRYQVTHAVWDVYPVQSFEIDLDWAGVYGPEWGFLKEQTPASTVLAVGSAIAVYPRGKL